MAEKSYGGVNLYQNKEPAFSREQRQLLEPKVLYIPMAPGADEHNASAFLDDVIFLGTFDFDYPGVEHTGFGRYKMRAHTKLSKPVKGTPDYDGEKAIKVAAVDADDLITIAKRAYIIDETDGIPLFKKLLEYKENKPGLVGADAIDAEPYVSSSVNTLLQKGGQVIEALKLIQEVFEIENIMAFVYADVDDTRTALPTKIGDVAVKKIWSRYPVQKRLEAKLASMGFDSGYGLIGVQALLHLYRAVYFGKKQNTTIVTVAGDCIGYSCNVEVTVGTTIGELLEFCGLVRDPARVIIRGTMRGVCVENMELPILHSCKSVLAFEDAVEDQKLPCVNCGKCIRVCPQRLVPSAIYKWVKRGIQAELDLMGADKCMECGCCSYVCPARLELCDTVAAVKKEKHTKGEEVHV